jgi:hypothetical protein
LRFFLFYNINNYIVQNAPANSPFFIESVESLIDEAEFKVFNQKFKKVEKYLDKLEKREGVTYDGIVTTRMRQNIQDKYKKIMDLREQAIERSIDILFEDGVDYKKQINILSKIKNSPLLTSERKENIVKNFKEKMEKEIEEKPLKMINLLLCEKNINLPEVDKYLSNVDIFEVGEAETDIDLVSKKVQKKILNEALEDKNFNFNFADLPDLLKEDEIELSQNRAKIREEEIETLKQILKKALDNIENFDDIQNILNTKLDILKIRQGKEEKKAGTFKERYEYYKKVFGRRNFYTFRLYMDMLTKNNLIEKIKLMKNVDEKLTFSSFKEKLLELLPPEKTEVNFIFIRFC